MKCVVPSCGNKQEHLSIGVSFHLFPKNEKDCILWKKALGIPNLEISKNSRLCSNHFLPEHFIAAPKCRRLTLYAVPIPVEEPIPTPMAANENHKENIPKTTERRNVRPAQYSIEFKSNIFEKVHFDRDDNVIPNDSVTRFNKMSSSGLKYVNAETNTCPDITKGYIKMLELQVMCLKETVKAKNRTIHALRQQIQRRKKKQNATKELANALSNEKIVSKANCRRQKERTRQKRMTPK